MVIPLFRPAVCLPNPLDWVEVPELFYFAHLPAPGSLCYKIGEIHLLTHQLAPEGPRPPFATSPQTRVPLIPDRDALCAPAQSLRSPIHFLVGH